MPEKKSLAEAMSFLDTSQNNYSSAKGELVKAINALLPHIEALCKRGDDIKDLCKKIEEAALATGGKIPIAYCEKGSHYYFTNMMVEPNTFADCCGCSQKLQEDL